MEDDNITDQEWNVFLLKFQLSNARFSAKVGWALFGWMTAAWLLTALAVVAR